jgi:hypothetical protein
MEGNSTEASVSSQKIQLFRNDRIGVEASIPEKPRVSVEKGLQVQIESTNPENKNLPKNILLRELYAITAAKVITEGDQTPEEAWANTRIEADNDVNAYGKNALNDEAWRKPVETDVDDEVSLNGKLPPEKYNQAKLQRLFRSYMHRWNLSAGKMSLFTDENGNISINKTAEVNIDTASENPNEDQTVWQSDKYIAKIIKGRHIKGIHIVVDPKLAPGESIPRQWMTRLKNGEDLTDEYIKMTLESTAIALGIRHFLAKVGQGEIHNSGNWAGGLKSTEEGGVLDLKNLQENAREEKRNHRPDVIDKDKQEKNIIIRGLVERAESGIDVSGEEMEEAIKNSSEVDKKKFGTFMHVHVYIPESGKVVLPEMSEGEAKDREAKAEGNEKDKYRNIIKQWGKIPQTPQETVDHVRKKLHNNLSDWVASNAAGNLAV